jgi:hypothetical protein
MVGLVEYLVESKKNKWYKISKFNDREKAPVDLAAEP